MNALQITHEQARYRQLERGTKKGQSKEKPEGTETRDRGFPFKPGEYQLYHELRLNDSLKEG